MQVITGIFGQGKDLSAYQTCARAVVVFFLALVLIRLSGRRSFGQKTPFDTIVAITMGATLSRAVIGASAFLPILSACLTIALLHRGFAWLAARNELAGRLAGGKRIVLFENGRFDKDNMGKALVCEEDIMRSIRKTALTGDLAEVSKVYMERDGSISVVKKGK